MLASKLSKVGQGHPHGSMRKRDRLILYTMQIRISVMPFPEKKSDPARATDFVFPA